MPAMSTDWFKWRPRWHRGVPPALAALERPGLVFRISPWADCRWELGEGWWRPVVVLHCALSDKGLGVSAPPSASYRATRAGGDNRHAG